MFEKIKNYAIENNVPIISDEVRDFICDYILENNVTNILEIGSAIGYSALCMASLNNNISIITIERNKNSYEMALKNFNDYDIYNQINILNMDALELDLDIINGSFDLIFIDGAKAQSQKFIEKYDQLLNKKGVMIIDNIDFHGFVSGNRETKNRNTRQLVTKIKKFINWIEDNEKYDAFYFNIGDGLYVIRKKNVND